MFGYSEDMRRSASVSDLQHQLRAIESRLARLGRNGSGRAEDLAESIVDRLGDVVERIRGGAMRAGDEASRLGHRAASTGREGISHLSREVSANPMIALGAAIGLGVIVGMTLLSSSREQPQPRPRRTTKGGRR
jgi:hypothetical protein